MYCDSGNKTFIYCVKIISFPPAFETETKITCNRLFVDSFEEHNYESDDANTSFGREILQAVCKNQTPHKRVSVIKKLN